MSSTDTTYDEFLFCPECGEPCTTMPGIRLSDAGPPRWDLDAEGVCQCGAKVQVCLGCSNEGDDIAVLGLQFEEQETP